MFEKIISAHFKRPSGLLGLFTANLMEKGNWRNYEVLLKELNPTAGDEILEIGYGPGIGISMLAKTCDFCIIHGIDFSKLMFKKAYKRNREYIDQKKVKLALGDFVEVTSDASTYDKIFCVNVIYFWDDLHKPFKKIRSLLKTGGLFCFYMAHRDFLIKKKSADEVFNKYSIEEVLEALKSEQFEPVSYSYDKGYYVKAKK